MALKKILLSILGEKKYLAFLAASFQRLYPTGRLGSQYQDIYFLKKFITPGSICVDIGAHLGYYTLELSRLAGPSGKVVAVEPVSKFNQTLQQLLKRRKADNAKLYQVALGGEGEWVEMGIPRIGNTKKFAYARVTSSHDQLNYVETEKVRNESGDHLFLGLSRVDFIKCDVEGLEVSVFRSMMATLSTHRPILLCELGDKKDRIQLYEMIQPLGYRPYLLEKGKLHLLDVHSDRIAISHNHYFIPAKQEERLKGLIFG